jgi:tryptophan synthase beta subunit
LRGKMLANNTMVPGGNVAAGSGGLTIEEYRSELNANYAKFKTDPAFRKEMERKLESIVGRK